MNMVRLQEVMDQVVTGLAEAGQISPVGGDRGLYTISYEGEVISFRQPLGRTLRELKTMQSRFNRVLVRAKTYLYNQFFTCPPGCSIYVEFGADLILVQRVD